MIQTDQTPREALTTILSDLPMPSITRHWVEEYLADLVDKDTIEDLQQRVHDLEEEVFSLESDNSSLETEVWELKQELDSKQSEYEPGVN